MALKSIYLIGSLRNPEIPEIGKQLALASGLEVFTSWHSAGPDADDHLRDYERFMGKSYSKAIRCWAATNIFRFDKFHLDRCGAGLLIMPAGKSGHLELGYLIGQGKPGYILFQEEPERFEVMHNFATEIFLSIEEAQEYFKNDH